MGTEIFLQKVKLENYKCFENTTVDFKDLTIIVGKNNAGKSCLVEALRLISVAVEQTKTRTVYKEAPKTLGLPLTLKGFEIKIEKLKIDLAKAIHFYKDTTAKITALFKNNVRAEIYITSVIAFAVFFDSKGVNVKEKKKIANLNLCSMGALPQIGLIRNNEKLLSEKTVDEDKNTYLTSLHFRNEIRLFNEYFELFKRMSEQTWEGLKLDNIEYRFGPNEHLKLFLTDNSFTAEIADMGSGIQMWLQIMWFLARTANHNVIILDEPDVYMHADLQSKLLDLVRQNCQQVIIATHSLEIIGRVSPENILSVDKKHKNLHYATDSDAVQCIVDNLGGVQNLSLIRLGLARKCLFVEGKDLAYLNRFSEILYGKKLDIPVISYGGFSKLSYVYGASKLLYSETNGSIKCFAIADRDYKTQETIDETIKKAQNEHLALHIWQKKEIENYLLNLDVLFRIIKENNKETYNNFLLRIEKFLDDMKDSVIDGYSDYLKSVDRSKEVSTCNIQSREIVNKMWNNTDEKISVVNGKTLLDRIRDYFKTEYNITLTDNLIQKHFTIADIPEELKVLLHKLQ